MTKLDYIQGILGGLSIGMGMNLMEMHMVFTGAIMFFTGISLIGVTIKGIKN